MTHSAIFYLMLPLAILTGWGIAFAILAFFYQENKSRKCHPIKKTKFERWFEEAIKSRGQR